MSVFPRERIVLNIRVNCGVRDGREGRRIGTAFYCGLVMGDVDPEVKAPIRGVNVVLCGFSFEHGARVVRGDVLTVETVEEIGELVGIVAVEGKGVVVLPLGAFFVRVPVGQRHITRPKEGGNGFVCRGFVNGPYFYAIGDGCILVVFDADDDFALLPDGEVGGIVSHFTAGAEDVELSKAFALTRGGGDVVDARGDDHDGNDECDGGGLAKIILKGQG